MNQPQVENSQQLWRGLNCPMLREVISYNIQLQCLVTDIVQLCLLISFTFSVLSNGICFQPAYKFMHFFHCLT